MVSRQAVKEKMKAVRIASERELERLLDRMTHVGFSYRLPAISFKDKNFNRRSFRSRDR